MKTFITIAMVFVFVKGFSQQSIYVTDSNGNLYSLNLVNCTSHLLGNTNNGFGDIAFTPNGNLWGIANGNIYHIDTLNAATTLIGYAKTGGVSLVALNDSVLLSEFHDSLFGINISTLHSYNMGNIGYQAAGDLTWYDNDLYMTSGDGFLIKIVLNGDNTAILSSAPVNSVENSILSSEGIITASFIGSENSIIGFYGPYSKAYKICPIDGSYTLLCDSLGFGIPGAASIRLPTQNPLPTSCSEIFPVKLLNFTSSLINNSVKLQWQTANEVNSNYFSIERSADGINFNAIGKVAAVGNSATLKQYSFIDASSPTLLRAEKGVFYRLKEVDKDGKFTYSNILFVKVPQWSNISVNPNPATDRIFITSSTSIQKIEILNPQGVVVMVKSDVNFSNSIFISNLSKGIYFLKAFTANGIVVKEFLKE